MRSLVAVALTVLLISGVLASRVQAQDASLLDLLPTAGEVGQGFAVTEERSRSLAEQSTGFSNADEAGRLLTGWRWQENALQRFASDTETVDISLTRFATAEDATLAMPYFLEDRAAILGQQEFRSLSQIGDEARAVNGFYNGLYDFTLYVRSGPLLMRISAASATGSPHASPERIALGIIERGGGTPAAATVTTEATAEQAANVALPESIPLSGLACSPMDDGGDVAALMERFDGIVDAAATLPAMGWLGGASRQFGCDDPPPGHVGWVNMSVHRFSDPGSAAGAVAYFADSRALVTSLQGAAPPALGDRAAALSGPTVNGTEYTVFVSRGDLLFRVTGVAPDGNPRSDVESIAAALYAQNTGETVQIAPTVSPVQVQETPAAFPTIAPVPTSTPIPTAMPMPTATPLPTLPPPTSTPIPMPTATPLPTLAPPPPTSEPSLAQPTAVPTTIPVVIPTAIPTAPATSSAPPTPTPRVIRPPTPVGG